MPKFTHKNQDGFSFVKERKAKSAKSCKIKENVRDFAQNECDHYCHVCPSYRCKKEMNAFELHEQWVKPEFIPRQLKEKQVNHKSDVFLKQRTRKDTRLQRPFPKSPAIRIAVRVKVIK